MALSLVVVRTAALVASATPLGPLEADEPFYAELAGSLVSGQGYLRGGEPSVLRPPGWPIVLAGLRILFGEGRSPVVVFQGLCDAGTAVLLGRLVLRLFESRLAAALAFMMALAWPPFFRESRLMQTEPFFTFLATALVAGFAWAVDRPGRRWIVVGLLTAGAAMVRPPALILIGGLVLGWLAFMRPPPRRALSSFAWMGLGLALVIAPWAVRNARVFHAFIPLSLGTGDQLFQGTMLETEGRWNQTKWIRARAEVLERERQRLGRPLNPIEADRATLRAAIETMREHPVRSAAIATKRLGRMWFTPTTSTDRAWLRWGFLITLVAIYALAFPAGLRAARATGARERLPAILLVGWVTVMFASALFLTNSRYAEPFRTIPLLLVSGTLARWLSPRDDVVGRRAP